MNIQEDKQYSVPDLVDLARQGFFPFRSKWAIHRLINKGLLKAHYIGTKEHKRYWILGYDLMDFLNKNHDRSQPTVEPIAEVQPEQPIQEPIAEQQNEQSEQPSEPESQESN